jgi:hypothetical protein
MWQDFNTEHWPFCYFSGFHLTRGGCFQPRFRTRQAEHGLVIFKNAIK